MLERFHLGPRQIILLSTASGMVLSLSLLTHAQALTTPALQAPGAVYQPASPPLSNRFPLPVELQQKLPAGEGQTFTFVMTHSVIFPKTTRKITVYIPAEYRADKPACVYVGLDGLSFNAAMVLDHLIADQSMPVTIAIGIAPGVVPSAQDPQDPRFDRSFEFDSLDDRLARFLVDEVLPEVQRQRSPDGQPILLSSNPDDRAIGGASTGGVAAFNVAWQHPEWFHRVFTAIGTFVGMRGAERLYVQVRKTEPKPIRIFMQDGVYDQWPGGQQMGDWWMSNRTMERALSFAGYEVNHEWGSGTHNNSHADAIFLAAMRWLWHDWPAPIQSGPPGNARLQEIATANEPWRLIADPCPRSPQVSTPTQEAHLAANQQGNVFVLSGNLEPIQLTGKASLGLCAPLQQGPALAFDGSNRLYRALPGGGIAAAKAVKASGNPSSRHADVLLRKFHIRDFIIRDNGDLYAITKPSAKTNLSELWLVPHLGPPKRLDETIHDAAGLALLPDAQWLIVTQSSSHSTLSYRVSANGTTDAREPFYDLESSPAEDYPAAKSVATDVDGRAYIATRLGVQVMDRNGRVVVIMPLPGGLAAESLCFGTSSKSEGAFDVLYVLANHKLFLRRLRVAGQLPASVPRIQPLGSPG